MKAPEQHHLLSLLTPNISHFILQLILLNSNKCLLILWADKFVGLCFHLYSTNIRL